MSRIPKDALAKLRQGGRRIDQYEDEVSEEISDHNDDDVRDFIVNDDGRAYEDEFFSEEDGVNVSDNSARLLREIARKETQRASGQQGLDRFLKKTGDITVRKAQNAVVAKNLDNILDNFESLLDDVDDPLPYSAPAVSHRRPVKAEVRAPQTLPDLADDFLALPPSKRIKLDQAVKLEPDFDPEPDVVVEPTTTTTTTATTNATTTITSTTDYAALSSSVEGGWGDMAMEVGEAAEVEVVEQSTAEAADGSLVFYYMDAVEEGSTVLLFGKTRSGDSTCVAVKGVNRVAYLLLRDQNTDEDEDKVKQQGMLAYQEFEGMRARGLIPKITKYKLKMVKRKFYFDVEDAPHGELWFLKIKYSAEFPPLPEGLKGESFSHVFGSSRSLVETVLVKQKIMGPCWVSVAGNPTKLSSNVYSHCQEEYIIPDLHRIAVLEADAPPLRVLALAIKAQVVPAKNGAAAHMVTVVSGYFLKAARLTAGEDALRRGDEVFTAVRVPEGRSLSRRDLEEVNRIVGASSGVEMFMNEKALLSWLFSKIKLLDPDVISGHKLCDVDLDLLVSRAQNLKINTVHFLSRKRVMTGGSPPWGARGHSVGRLLLDTYLSAKELLGKEVNYELDTLVTKVLGGGARRASFVQEMLLECFASPKSLAHLVMHTVTDALFTLRLGWRLQVLPLTKQLSNIAGNLWAHSLLNRRAERNEWLLVHEFARHKFVLPDKVVAKKRQQGRAALDEFDDPEAAGGEAAATVSGGKKPTYLGGLVLEPKTGLYEDLVLLLDFNSLYPSIIREYNICFTTVQRVSAAAETQGGLPELPEPADGAVLPGVITRLVETRKKIKQLLQKEKDGAKREMLDIKQKAVKLIANSMYGCLGFSSSRFYARQLAALITATGRKNLEATVRLVEEEMRLSVVYGDTDSIFVASRTKDFAEAMQIGKQIAQNVNKKYTKLEIEIDGVYKKLLLLKKKKYAGLSVVDWDRGVFSLETKGLDLVRRDWCVLSKKMGGQILEILLQKNEQDPATVILEYLKTVNARIDAGLVGVEDWAITKTLTKHVHEYPDAKNQPHVLVAKRLIEQGGIVKPGTELAYVITKEGPDGAGTMASRARGTEEAKREQLEVDVMWYKQQQLFPPISRLLVPAGLVEAGRIAEAMGLDPAKFEEAEETGEKPEEEDFVVNEDPEVKYANLKLRFREKIPCPKCKTGLKLVDVVKLGACQTCSVKLPEGLMKNAVVLTSKDLLAQANQGGLVCNDDQCRKHTRQVWCLGAGTRCPQPECTGKLEAEISTSNLYQHFTFLVELCRKFKKPALADFVADKYVDKNACDVVNVGTRFAVFALMLKPKDIVRGA